MLRVPRGDEPWLPAPPPPLCRGNPLPSGTPDRKPLMSCAGLGPTLTLYPLMATIYSGHLAKLRVFSGLANLTLSHSLPNFKEFTSLQLFVFISDFKTCFGDHV